MVVGPSGLEIKNDQSIVMIILFQFQLNYKGKLNEKLKHFVFLLKFYYLVEVVSYMNLKND